MTQRVLSAHLSQAPVTTDRHKAVGSKGARLEMYLQRRHGRYWFRKATPLDLVEVLGQAEVRYSLRTNRRDVAQRRAGALLVALEIVYAVLRSDEPLAPAQALLNRFLQDVSENASGTPESMSMAAVRLQEAASSLGPPAPPLSNGEEETWVSVENGCRSALCRCRRSGSERDEQICRIVTRS
jgi:hypothetical protein